jgi:catechol 2,3-dioxygenase-like lactoylglutathione lyase family enzyme
MAPELNHTIVNATDKEVSARFLAEVMGLGDPEPWGPFLGVETGNGVALDFIDAGDYQFSAQHYAFLVSDDEFDEIFGRVQERGVDYWADPHKQRPGEINHNDGGRGVYFDDPDHHLLEIITRPYGSGS